MKVLIDGYLSFYELVITGWGAGNVIIYEVLKREDEDQLLSVYGKDFRARAINYFEDAPDIQNKIRIKEYGRNDIGKIVKEYNLLKFKPSDVIGYELNPVAFYCLNENLKDLILTVNDKNVVRLDSAMKNNVLFLKIPTTIKTKICFGVKNKLECDLFSTLPHSAVTDYFNLWVNPSKTKFRMERKITNQAQQDLFLYRNSKR